MENFDIDYKRKLKDSIKPEFDKYGHQTIQSMRYGTIDKTYLHNLLMKHREEWQAAAAKQRAAGVAKPRGCPVDEHLGAVIQVVVDKTAGMPYWHDYTPEWKQQMKDYAIDQLLLYCHNYDPVKMVEKQKNGKNGKNDPYYYLANSVSRAFGTVVKNLKEDRQRIKFTSLNENMLSQCTTMDEYAGVLEAETAKQKAEIEGNAGLVDLEEGVSAIDAIEKE